VVLPGGLAYGRAIQHPEVAFSRDPILASASPVPGLFGQPKAHSGNFAIVFQLRTADGRTWAAKCFTKEVTQRDERYRAIHEVLEGMDRPWEVAFDYRSDGILVDGDWLPMVRMEWIDAVTLGTYLRDEDVTGEDIERISEGFRRVVVTLHEDGIAHGDLQHGNVLVDRAGEVRLVDYDGMFVPSIAHLEAAELGHPSYQSPMRDRTHFDRHIDRHSAWVIHAALRARALEPALFFELDRDEDGLLLGPADFDEPFSAMVLERFVGSGGELKALAHDLVEVLGRAPEDVPPFDPCSSDVVVGETCRPSGRCELCEAPLCRLCDRGALSCARCLAPERAPTLDTATSLAWLLGNDMVLQVGRRVVRCLTADGDERVLVPPDDVDREARVAVRRYAQAHGHPLDVGAVLRRAPSPQADGQFEWLRREGSTTNVAYDLTAPTAKVVGAAAECLDIEDGSDVDVESLSNSPLGELVTKLRRRAKPPSPGQLIVELEEEWTRVRLVPEGLRWQRERRTPEGAVLVKDVGLEAWRETTPDGQRDRPHLFAEFAGVRGRLEPVHRSLVVTVSNDDETSSWFVPHELQASEAIETVLAAHPLVAAGARITCHGQPGAVPSLPDPTGAQLVRRSSRSILLPTLVSDPRLDDLAERSPTLEDLPRLGLPPVPSAAATQLRPRLGRSMSAGLFAVAQRHLPAPVVHPHLPGAEVVETWRAAGEATVRYVAEVGRPVGPIDEAGQTLTDFTVDSDGGLVPLAAARPCRECRAVVTEGELVACEGCGRPVRCSTCAPPATSPTGDRCAGCGVLVCSACDLEGDPVRCVVCAHPLCSTCGDESLCSLCDPATWRPWTDPLPQQLRANRLRVIGRRDGAQLRLYLEGPRRREFAVVDGDTVRRWTSPIEGSQDTLRLARRWQGASDVTLVVSQTTRTESTAIAGLSVERHSTYAVRWSFSTGFVNEGGEIALESEPECDLTDHPRVLEHFGLRISEEADDWCPQVVDVPASLLRRFAATARRLPQPPDDRVELSLAVTDHDLRLDAGGFAVGAQRATPWRSVNAELEPWVPEMPVAHLEARWGAWHARLLRVRTAVVLVLAEATGRSDSWLVTGDPEELLRVRQGTRWLRQPALVYVTAQLSPADLRGSDCVPRDVLVKDPSSSGRPAPAGSATDLSDVGAHLKLEGLPERVASDLAAVAYGRLAALPDVPVQLGVRGTTPDGGSVDLWPPGVEPPRRWLHDTAGTVPTQASTFA
jgi:hypothetical protein